jgi:hydroxymethylpyrimidine kinase/phosphomethylpyrimidine kinase
MTRQSAPVSPPVALTIASSDSGGGAGIQADLKTMEACGAFATSVICATTAQNTHGVESVHVLPMEEINAQYEAVVSDFDLGGVKTGMLATAEIVETVTDYARDLDAPLVCDPVMVAASGDRLLEPAGEDAYEDLVAAATLVTPNADECEVLTGTNPTDEERAREAGEELVEMGTDAALVKGGHISGEMVTDVLVTGEGSAVFEHPRVETDATHGSGCALASAIAARLAHGDALDSAVEEGLALMERAIRYPFDVGEGPGSVQHLANLRDRAARDPTAKEIETVVEGFVEQDVSPLVPEVGMNVVGATPYAETPSETAAVEGRITQTLSGVKPNRGVRFGASSHVARFLLAAREFDSELRFAVNCRFDDHVEGALDDFDWPVAEYDRSEEPEEVKEAAEGTMGWGARQAFEESEETPVAVIDRGEVGKEAMVKLLAADSGTLAERTLSLLDALTNN